MFYCMFYFTCDRSFSCVVAYVDAVEIRNRMRSVDDLRYYGQWKRESLRARRQSGDGGGSVSLNQSYSSASTLTATAATDDEGRLPGPTQRRRRSLRVRRRSAPSGGSIVSAPTPRPINLDESVGSGALDVDSMLRFFAASMATSAAAAYDEVRSPTAKHGLPPPGLPPSGRTTSARRTFQRRRRPQVTDVVNDSTDTVSSSFDDVQMTSSNVDLKAATAAAAAAAVVAPAAIESESSGVQRSGPVRRSLRRRRRPPSESPSPDVSDAAAPVTSAAPTDVTNDVTTDVTGVTEPEALWELCGEKLKEVCRRILDVGVTDTDHDVAVTGVRSPDSVTECENIEVEITQPSHTAQQSPPPDDFSVSERRPEKDAFSDGDLNAYRLSLIADVIPVVDQLTSHSSVREDLTVDNCNGAETSRVDDVGNSELGDERDEVSKCTPTSLLAVAAEYESVESPKSRVPALDGELDVERFETVTYSPEHRHDRLEPPEEIVSDQPRTVGMPPDIGENAAHAADVPDLVNGDRTSNIIGERSGLPDLDIGIMLSPAIELQDILDTIHTLTGGVEVEDRAIDDAGTPSPPPHGGLPTSGDEAGCLQIEDDYQQLVGDADLAEQLAARLDGAERDDDDDDSLELDADMYDFDVSPPAADFADSLHLAIAEDDDDDLDIEHYEYDLDDDEVL